MFRKQIERGDSCTWCPSQLFTIVHQMSIREYKGGRFVTSILVDSSETSSGQVNDISDWRLASLNSAVAMGATFQTFESDGKYYIRG